MNPPLKGTPEERRRNALMYTHFRTPGGGLVSIKRGASNNPKYGPGYVVMTGGAGAAHLTPDQARELAAILIEQAERAEPHPRTVPP